jgi:hypothetical protein
VMKFTCGENVHGVDTYVRSSARRLSVHSLASSLNLFGLRT